MAASTGLEVKDELGKLCGQDTIIFQNDLSEVPVKN